MAHGIARFSPKYCNDKMRFWTLGQSEAAFWDRTVFSIMDPETIPEQDNLQQSPSQVAQGLHDQHTSSTPGIHTLFAQPVMSDVMLAVIQEQQ